MAAIDVTIAVTPHHIQANAVMDPSRPAFWLPFQDITTHNHTPQWTQSAAPPPDAGAPCIPNNGNCTTGGSCCAGLQCMANGTCQAPPQ